MTRNEVMQFTAVPSFVRGDALVAVISPFEVYFDETGCHGDAEVFIWAGYLAPRVVWEEFSFGWEQILRESPEIPYWHTHSAHYRKRKTPFEFLTQDDVAAKEEKLARFIASMGTRIVGLVTRLPTRYVREYVTGQITFARDLAEQERKELGAQLLEKPHYIAFHYSLLGSTKLAERSGSGVPVHYIYEQREGDPYEASVQEILASFRASASPQVARLMGGLTFVPGKRGDARPLEAADMLAWHLNRRTKREGVDQPNWEHVSMTRMNERTIGVADLRNYVRLWNAGEAIEWDRK